MNAYGPLLSAQSVADFATTLVIAPPSNDKPLGCGGTIALLRQQKQPVSVLVPLTKAASSSTAAIMASLRRRQTVQTETLAALDRLGVSPASVRFLELPGNRPPRTGEAGFAETLYRCMDYLTAINPNTVLLPWQQTAPGAGGAIGELVAAAAAQIGLDCRWLEYPTGASDVTQPSAAVLTNSRAWRLDITSVIAAKQSALAAYRSSAAAAHSGDAAPALTPPWEVFLEYRSAGAAQAASVAV